MSSRETLHDLELLAASLEDRLDPQERARLEAHLADCAECRGTLAALSRAAAAGALPVVPVRERRERRAWPLSGRVWLPVAASVTIAAVVGLRLLPVGPRVEVSPPAGSAPVVEKASPPAAVSPSPPSLAPSSRERTASPATIDEGLLVKRGAQRRMAGKVFRRVDGAWVDVRFDPSSPRPVVDIAGPDQRAAWLARVPGLAPYAALGDRVVVVLDGTVYRFSP